MSSVDQEGPQNLEPLVQALRRKISHLDERIDELEENNRRLSARVSELEAARDGTSIDEDYRSMDRETKVQKIRLSLVKRAAKRATGKAQMDYKEVLALFDQNPSSGHAYDLMRLTGQKPGFDYYDAGTGNDKIRVDLEAVNDETMLSHANKHRPSEEA